MNFINQTNKMGIMQGPANGKHFLFYLFFFCKLLLGSSHIRSVLIGVEYRNCHRTLDIYLLFAILLKSKLNYRLVTYKLASPQDTNM